MLGVAGSTQIEKMRKRNVQEYFQFAHMLLSIVTNESTSRYDLRMKDYVGFNLRRNHPNLCGLI